jgi:S-formylglutathione hydrolase FrmB
MLMGKDRLLPILALLILITASTASLYVHAIQTTTETLTVNGQDYTMDQLFSLTKPRSINESEFTGVALDDLLLKTGASNPEQHQYTLRGADGYEKTVTWDNMKNGLLTKNRESIFSDLPKAFRVKDIVTIEVK